MQNYNFYSASGNRFIIHHLPDQEAVLSLRNSMEDQQRLANIGMDNKIDSVMVIVGNPENYENQGYHVTMDVFEPNAFHGNNTPEAWSTMCGNGVRSVAQFLYDNKFQQNWFDIKTRSGVQRVVRQGDLWSVNMGYFTQDARDLSRYIRDGHRLTGDSVSFGLHYQDIYNIDGEPHADIFTNPNMSCDSVISLANERGSLITHNLEVFPLEINTNIVSIINRNEMSREISARAATYERNVHYVTQSC